LGKDDRVPVMFRRMVVVGVGLIGGSLALDARKHGLVEEVIGFGRTERNLRLAKKQGIIDRFLLDERAIPEDTDFLLNATPVSAVAETTAAFLPMLRPGCIVSDVGSVKGKLVREMDRLLPRGIPFVGAHPIAGSEQWGAGAARTNLFVRRRCILTPTQKTDRRALKKVAALWRRVGARVEIMDADTHDMILGLISHVPHVLVYALVNAVARTRVRGISLTNYCAGGFKDFTRIASSRPELWRDICLMNRKAIGKALDDYITYVERLKRWMKLGKGALLEREFARANDIRARLPSA
jgi:prephenate dehydrogenase